MSEPAAAIELAGTADHPSARVTLTTALRTGASHAYLFHGPAGVGKREAARAFAAELLAAGSSDPDSVRHRVATGTHPDLTWVSPTGAHVMRTGDVDQPVVAASTRTPFEASKRVFVLERVDTMNDEVANRMLKTLEEPPSFVHLVLISDSLGQVIDTVVSRCQLVRFDPLPAARLAEALKREGVESARAGASAALALGNGERARLLASDAGGELMADVDRILEAALRPAGQFEPWRALHERAVARQGVAEDEVGEARDERLKTEPKGRERGALEKQFDDAAKRAGRRARTEVLDLGLTLAALGFRDLICLAEGVPEAALDAQRATRLAGEGAPRDARRLRRAAERCEEVRMSLQRNVSEDLALEALGYRLAQLVGR